MGYLVNIVLILTVQCLFGHQILVDGCSFAEMQLCTNSVSSRHIVNFTQARVTPAQLRDYCTTSAIIEVQCIQKTLADCRRNNVIVYTALAETYTGISQLIALICLNLDVIIPSKSCLAIHQPRVDLCNSQHYQELKEKELWATVLFSSLSDGRWLANEKKRLNCEYEKKAAICFQQYAMCGQRIENFFHIMTRPTPCNTTANVTSTGSSAGSFETTRSPRGSNATSNLTRVPDITTRSSPTTFSPKVSYPNTGPQRGPVAMTLSLEPYDVTTRLPARNSTPAKSPEEVVSSSSGGTGAATISVEAFNTTTGSARTYGGSTRTMGAALDGFLSDFQQWFKEWRRQQGL